MPVNVIVVPPLVGIVEPLAITIAVIFATVYDTIDVDSELACPPTIAIKRKFPPTPVAVEHRT